MEKEDRGFPFLITASIILIIELIFKLFKYDLIAFFTEFFYPYAEIAIDVLAVLSFVALIIYAVIKRRDFFKRKLWMSLVASMLACLLVVFPAGDIAENIRFRLQQENYTAIAQIALDGDYTDAKSGTKIGLPFNCKGLSRGGGEIFVFKEGENGAVFFFRLRGILDNFSGYVYLANKTSDYLLDEFGDWEQKVCITDNWYLYFSR